MYTKSDVGGISLLPERTSSFLILFAFPSFLESLESARFVLPFYVRWLEIHISKRSLDFRKLQEENVSVSFITVDDTSRCQQNTKQYYHEV